MARAENAILHAVPDKGEEFFRDMRQMLAARPVTELLAKSEGKILK